MPSDLPLGNGNLLVNFDKDYNLRDIYYPYVGKANQSARRTSRTGILVDGQFSWLSDPEWSKDLDYVRDSLTTNVKAANGPLELQLTFNDTVDFHRDILLRRVEVFNLSQRPRNVRLFFHYDFLFWGVGSGDSIHYHPNGNFLVAYKDNCYFLMNATTERSVGISSWTTGFKDDAGLGGSWSDAQDGILEENSNSFGSIDGVIAVDLSLIPPGESRVCHAWLAAGQDMEEVRVLDAMVRRREPQYLINRTTNYWRAWLEKEDIDFHGLPHEVEHLYKRSLLILRTHVDNRGGIVAANDSDLSFLVYGQESYSYVWPRDGAYFANALDKAGYAHLATRFYNFCNDVIHRDPTQKNDEPHEDQAYMLQKYTPDKLVASNWMARVDEEGSFRPPIEEDETALVSYAVWQHYLKYRDIEALVPWFQPLLLQAANFMVEFRENHTKLPAPSYDLWEERVGIYSYTVATVWAGLNAAANAADLFGEAAAAGRFRSAAAEIKAACETYLYDEKLGRFLKRISVNSKGEIEPDSTVDVSLYALWYFGMFDPNDPRIVGTMNAIVDRLSCQTDIGGLARYEGDEYHWDAGLQDQRDKIPGNPWIISTLFLAQYQIATAQSIDDLKQVLSALDWVCARALRSGVLPEQIHPLTGEHLSVAPLTWSHAMVVSVVNEYLEKYEELQRGSPE